MSAEADSETLLRVIQELKAALRVQGLLCADIKEVGPRRFLLTIEGTPYEVSWSMGVTRVRGWQQ